jgi:hypothetical protein
MAQPNGPDGVGGNPFADLDQRLEEIFEKADDFMINKKSFKDAVSVPAIL